MGRVPRVRPRPRGRAGRPVGRRRPLDPRPRARPVRRAGDVLAGRGTRHRGRRTGSTPARPGAVERPALARRRTRRARALDVEPRPGRARRRGEGDPRPARRRRVLPGEPDPPALAPRAADPRAVLRVAPPEPGAAQRAAHLRSRSAVLPGRGVRVTRALPRASRRPRHHATDQGHQRRPRPRCSAATRTAPST